MDMRAEFVRFDRNGDGTLNLDEFRGALRKARVAISDPEVRRVFSAFDRNGAARSTTRSFSRRRSGATL